MAPPVGDQQDIRFQRSTIQIRRDQCVRCSGKIDATATMFRLGVNGGGWGDLLNGEHWLEGSPREGLGWPPQGGPCAINCTSAVGFGFHSFHPGGANFSLVDGSVQFVGENVDAKIFASGITRNGGEVPGI